MATMQTPEFWVAVGFLLLIGLVAKPAWTVITNTLDARSKKIEENLNAAASLREEVQHLLADYQRRQRDATREVDEMLSNAANEAELLLKEEFEKLAESLKRREELAMDKISQAQADAIQTVRNRAIEISILATHQILTEQLDKDVATKLIDKSIQELPDNLH
tara:strand:- start:43 stop:531 length:489 start_codon:yes stop_codon:yes gene_type:complete